MSIIKLRQCYQALLACVEQSIVRLKPLPKEELPPLAKAKVEEYLAPLQKRIIQQQQQLLGSDAFALVEDVEHYLKIIRNEAIEQFNQLQRQDISSSYQGITGEAQRVCKDIFKRLENLADTQAHRFISQQSAQDWHTHSSPLQQQALVGDPDQRQRLSTILEQVAVLHQKRKQHKVSCFISYAWPSEKRLYESWVQPFLVQLARHLRQAGLRIYLDIDDSRYGFDSYYHMRRILSSDIVLLIGTESLVDKHQMGISNVCNELNLIRDKRIQDQQRHHDHGVIPLLLSGTIEEAFPEEYRRYTVMESFVVGHPISVVDKGYSGKLKELVAKMYDWSLEDREYQACWQNAPDDWFKPLAQEVVEAKLKQQTLAYAYKALTQATTPPVAHWEIPSANPHFVGRLAALEEIAKSLQYEGSIGLISQAITGLGGVGKTQLANHYVYCALRRDVLAGRALDYDAVFWLRAQDLNASINKIAEKYQIDPLRYQGQEQELFRAVYQALSKQYAKVLLVLDDVEDYESIVYFLPGQYLQRGFQCHVLMTSRQQHWPSVAQIRQVALQDFTSAEAVEYILKSLPKETPSSAQKLAELLHYFPLALAQAVAYIQKSKSCNIEKYLSYYAQEKSQLLAKMADVLPGQLEDDRKRAVYTTWHISIEKMRGKGEALAEHVLNLSAYLAPQAISLPLLVDILKCSDMTLGEALSVLEEYSLIEFNEESQTIAVHQLLQAVIRLHLASLPHIQIKPNRFETQEEIVNLLIENFVNNLKHWTRKEKYFYKEHIKLLIVNANAIAERVNLENLFELIIGLTKIYNHITGEKGKTNEIIKKFGLPTLSKLEEELGKKDCGAEEIKSKKASWRYKVYIPITDPLANPKWEAYEQQLMDLRDYLHHVSYPVQYDYAYNLSLAGRYAEAYIWQARSIDKAINSPGLDAFIYRLAYILHGLKKFNAAVLCCYAALKLAGYLTSNCFFGYQGFVALGSFIEKGLEELKDLTWKEALPLKPEDADEKNIALINQVVEEILLDKPISVKNYTVAKILGRFWCGLGECLMSLSLIDEASQAFTNALNYYFQEQKEQKGQEGFNNITYIWYQGDYGACQICLYAKKKENRRLKEAIKIIQECLDIESSHHPFTRVALLNNLAIAYFLDGEQREAQTCFQEGKEILHTMEADRLIINYYMNILLENNLLITSHKRKSSEKDKDYFTLIYNLMFTGSNYKVTVPEYEEEEKPAPCLPFEQASSNYASLPAEPDKREKLNRDALKAEINDSENFFTK